MSLKSCTRAVKNLVSTVPLDNQMSTFFHTTVEICSGCLNKSSCHLLLFIFLENMMLEGLRK